MISIDMYKETCQNVIDILRDILPGDTYEYNPVYSYRSLEVISTEISNMTRIYFRIVHTLNGMAVDVSNIDLDPSIQRQGIFTSFVSKALECENIDEIWVSSVLTPEMNAACKKLNMTVCEEICGYKIIK